MNRRFYLSLITLAAFILTINFGVSAQDGETVFKSNCAACHTVGGGRLVGPDLAGITERRSEDWIKEFILHSQALIESGDADAKAIFDEYKMPMPDQNLNDADLAAVMDYLSASTGGSDTAGDAPIEEVVYEAPGDESVNNGLALFSGSTRFENGGASCATCHHVDHAELMSGGTLAKDLTDAHQRMGDPGVRAIMSAPPFPAMASAYKNNPLTEAEISDLSAFLYSSSQIQMDPTAPMGYYNYLIGGFIILVVILVIISILWAKRKKGTVKEDIFSRQLVSTTPWWKDLH